MSSLLHVGFLGVDEGGDPKNQPPGMLRKADNCAMDKARRLIKRKGTTGLTKTALSGSAIAAGKRLLTTGTDLAVTDGQTVWAYAESLAKWNPIDRLPNLAVTTRPLVGSSQSAMFVDTAISGTMLITAYVTDLASGGGPPGRGTLFVKVEDLTTGASLLSPSLIQINVSYPRLLISGTTALLAYSANDGTVCCSKLNLTTLATPTNGTTLEVDANENTPIDAVVATPTGGVPTLYLAYGLESSTSRLGIRSYLVSSLADVASQDFDTNSTDLLAVGVAANASRMAIMAVYQRMPDASPADTILRSVPLTTSSFGTQVGPTVVDAFRSTVVFVDFDDATNMLVGWGRTNGTGDTGDRLTTALYSIAANVQVASSVRKTFGLFAPSKPWRTASRWYASAVVFVHGDFSTGYGLSQPSVVVIEIETTASLTGVVNGTHPQVATLENLTGWYPPVGDNWPNGFPMLIKSSVDSDGVVYLAVPSRDREPTGNTEQLPVDWNLKRIDVSGDDLFRPAGFGTGALVACGAPAWFDGLSVMPYGFAHAPTIVTVVASNDGGVLDNGVYSYVAVYTWRDAHGLLHRSIPSAPVTGTSASSNKTLTVTVTTAALSSKQRVAFDYNAPSRILIEIYRTTVGGTGPHYLLTLVPQYSELINDPKVATVALVDVFSDANISGTPTVALASRPQLYTDLGELENVPPPSFITATIHKNRLVGIAGDQHMVWFSKDASEDLTQAPGFNEALTLSFVAEKTALASLNATLVVFGEDGIDVVHGDGLDASGAGAWQTQRVQTDLGCTNPRSVVTTPMGVMFRSVRGLELLDVGLSVTWIGEPIQDTVALFPNITSATLVASQQEVRFTCDDGSSGIVLVYDYGYKIWFVRRYNDAADTAADNIKFVDAALIDGTYTLLTARGQIYRETTAHKLDNGTHYVRMDVILAPISAQPGRSGWSNENLGWTRFKDVALMGTSVTNHDLTVSTANDFATSYGYTKTFLAGSAVTATGTLEKCRATPPSQKCQAIQIRIQDATPTDQSSYPVTTGDGPILEALALRVSPLTGPAKTAAGQQG